MTRRSSSERASRSQAKVEPGTEPGGAHACRPGRTVLVLLLLIIIVGAALRLYGLSVQSLWLDELWTWQFAHKATLTDVLTTGRLPHDVHPPLYFMMHYYLQKYVGESETVLRLPAALAGVLSIAVIYLLGRRLYGDTEGLIAAALTAVLMRHIYYSQEARAYSMMILFAMLTVYFWVPVVRSLCRGERPDVRTLVGHVASTVVLSYVHYYGLYLVAFEGLAAAVIVLWKRPRVLFAVPLVYLPVVLIYIPWLPTMLRSMKTTSVSPKPPEVLVFLTWMGYVFPAHWKVQWVALGVYLWLAGLTVFDVVRRRTAPASPTPHAGVLLVLWLVVPFAAVQLQAALWRSTFTLRNMLICLPPAYLLVARGIARIPVPRVVHAVVTAAVAALLVAGPLLASGYYSRPIKDQYREAVTYVVENDPKYPNAMIVGWRDPPDLFNYYFMRLHSPRRVNAWVAAGYAPELVRLIDRVRPGLHLARPCPLEDRRGLPRLHAAEVLPGRREAIRGRRGASLQERAPRTLTRNRVTVQGFPRVSHPGFPPGSGLVGFRVALTPSRRAGGGGVRPHPVASAMRIRAASGRHGS